MIYENLSIAKAIGIILMVIGHAGCPPWMHDYIYLFHMPLFFLVSGYLFKDKYLRTPIRYLKAKINGIYVPFVKWSLFFLCIHNLLFHLGIYNISYSETSFWQNALKYVTLNASEELLGGYWFLIELLKASIVCYGIIFICDMLRIYIHRYIHIYIVSVLLFIFIYWQFDILQSIFIKIKVRTLIAILMFMSGYFIKSASLDFSKKIYLLGYVIPLIIVVVSFNLGDMVTLKREYLLLYCIVATAGSLATIALSTILLEFRVVSRSLIEIGTQTLYILTFHLLAFKLVSFVAITICGKEGNLYDFPVIPNLGGLWWVLYTIVGLTISLLLFRVSKKMDYWCWDRLVSVVKSGKSKERINELTK